MKPNILTMLFAAVAYVFKFLCHRAETAKDRKADAAAVAAAKDRAKIGEEVRKGDVDAVNRRIQDFRRTPLPCVLVLLAGLALAGCRTPAPRVVYVPERDKAVPMENAGRPGWWVPDHVMIDLLERATDNANAAEAAKTEATR